MDLENEEIELPEDAPIVEEPANESAIENVPEETFSSELAAPHWSVVSFEHRVAGSLTYAEAAEKLNRLAAEKVSGLCIITDAAADRIKNQN